MCWTGIGLIDLVILSARLLKNTPKSARSLSLKMLSTAINGLSLTKRPWLMRISSSLMILVISVSGCVFSSAGNTIQRSQGHTTQSLYECMGHCISRTQDGTECVAFHEDMANLCEEYLKQWEQSGWSLINVGVLYSQSRRYSLFHGRDTKS